MKLLSAVAVAGALIPAVADAKLGGQPQMHMINSHQASLRFAADKKPSTITFANGAKVGAATKVGTHGSDNVYRVRVTSSGALHSGTKYTVTFTFPGEKPDKRLVKLY
jgi:hypothetical protein